MPMVELRYADAFAELAEARGKLDEYGDQLAMAADVFLNEKELKAFLTDPRIKTTAKKDFLAKIFQGLLDPEVFNLIKLLVDKERTALLPGIHEEYKALAEKKKKVLKVLVASALPVGQEQLNNIGEKYRKLYGAMSVQVMSRIEPDLLGGIKVTIGDKVYDNSIKGRLEALKEIIVR